MGRVKELLPEAWTGPEYDQEPDELEMLKIDAEQALERYEAALKKSQPPKGYPYVKPV